MTWPSPPKKIRELVAQNHQSPISAEAAAELANASEGWITGLLLSAHIHKMDPAVQIRLARASGVDLYDYLADQVLDQQPEPVRRFLLRSSLLDGFNAERCEAVLRPTVYPEGADWGMLLEHLLRHNLFATQAGDSSEWLRYHVLFQEFLQAHLAKEYPEEYNLILHQLAQYHVERGNWDHAHAIYQRLGDRDGEARVVEQSGTSLIKSGWFAALAQWLNELPKEILLSNPALLSLKGVVTMVGKNTGQAVEFLSLAETRLRATGNVPLLARTLARRCSANHFLGRYQVSLEDAQEALRLVADRPDLLDLKAEALYLIGCNQHLFGQAGQAIANLQQSLATYETLNDEHNIANVLYNLGLSYRYLGDFWAAKEAYEQSLAYWRRTNNLPRSADLLNNLGVLHQYMGDYEQSARLLSEGLQVAQEVKYARTEASLLCCFGAIYIDLGLLEAAQESFVKARKIAERIGQRQLLFYLDQTEAALACDRGDYDTAHILLESAQSRLQDNGCTYEHGRLCQSKGKLALAEQDFARAQECFTQAVQKFSDGDWCTETARSRMYLAQVCDRLGDESAALQHVTLAFRCIRKPEYLHILVTMAKDVAPLLAKYQSAPGVSDQITALRQRVEQFKQQMPALQRKLQQKDPAIPAPPPQIGFQTLGEIQIGIGDRLLAANELPPPLLCELLFFILAHPEGVSRNKVLNTLWPGIEQPGPLLDTAIYRIRRLLGKNAVVLNSGRYLFNRELDYEYDAEQFLKARKEAMSVGDVEQKAQAYREMAALYRGYYLPNLDSAWIISEREYLHQSYTEAIAYLSQYHLKRNEREVSLDYCSKAIRIDPCLENIHRLCMQIYNSVGNRTAVEHQYQACCQALERHLHSRPSTKTQMLYQKLIR